MQRTLDCLDDVCIALPRLDCSAEITTWLQRMGEWWNALSDGEQREHRYPYLITLARMLANLSGAPPEDALLRLEASLPQILAPGDQAPTHLAGVTLEWSGQWQRALALDELALTQPMAEACPDVEEYHRKQAAAGIDRMRLKLAPAEPAQPRPQWPWWQFRA